MLEAGSYSGRCQLKCDKCGYVSFDYNHECPNCQKDLGIIRSRLGIGYEKPQVIFDELFTGHSGGYQTLSRTTQEQEAELDLESVGDEFEFTLDD